MRRVIIFKEMIIGIDASRANLSHKTGVEWYAYYLIRWFAKLDSKNEYILYTNKPLRGGLLDLRGEQFFSDDKKEEKIEFKNGYQVLKSPHNNFKAKVLSWPFDFFWTQGGLSLEMLFHKPDVLFVPAHTLPLIHPKNSIVTIHDIAYEHDETLYEKTKIGPQNGYKKKVFNLLAKLFTFGKYEATVLDYLRWSTKFSLKNAKKIITISNFTKDDLIKTYNADADKIEVIYHGYNKFLYNGEADRKKTKEILYKYGVDTPYLFYIGRIENKKNLPALIEAFALLKEDKKIKEKLVLVGRAGYGYDEVNYMIDQFNLSDEVIIPGWVEEDDLPFFYAGATAFVFPSKYEGFGIPLLQAMASGVPIVTSKVSAIPEVVQNSVLFFDPYNIDDMKNKIKKIIIDKGLQKELVKKGKERIKYFSWEKCAKETLNIIYGGKN